MKKEVDLARHQVDTVAAAAAKGGDDNNTQDIPFTAAGGQHLPPQLLSGAQPGATPSATAAVGASASELWRAESAGKALHSARLEAALTEAEQRLAGVRVKAEAAAGEAEDKIAEVRAGGDTREQNAKAWEEGSKVWLDGFWLHAGISRRPCCAADCSPDGKYFRIS